MKEIENSRDNYFEGTLQLRNPTPEILTFIHKRMSEKPDVFIAKTEKIGNGMDYYMSSNRFLRNLGKMLHKQFGGELKMSAKLFTRDWVTSKDVFRLCVLFRAPRFKVGQIIEYRGEKIKILKVDKKIFGKSLDNGKKISLNHAQMN